MAGLRFCVNEFWGAEHLFDKKNSHHTQLPKPFLSCAHSPFNRAQTGKSGAFVLEFVLERDTFYSPFATATISYEKPVFHS
jgi:hypothetical protein